MRKTAVLVGVGVLTATGADLAANVAAGQLPAGWQPYLWISWPVLGLTIGAAALAEILQKRRVSTDPKRAPGTVARHDSTAPSSDSPERIDAAEAAPVVQNVVVGPGATAAVVLNGNIIHHHDGPHARPESTR